MQTKIYKSKEFNDGYLGLRQTKSVLAIFAIGIIIHHISLKTHVQLDESSIVRHILDPFRALGYLFVSYFFFCSGFGIFKSFTEKEDYLKGFLRKHLVPVCASFFVVDILFQIERIKRNAFGFPANTYSWFIFAILAAYIGFFVCARFFKKHVLAGLFATAVIWCAICKLLVFDSYWYNTILAFPLGAVFAQNYNSITEGFKKRYAMWLVISFAGTCLLHFFAADDMRLFGIFGGTVSYSWTKEIQALFQIAASLVSCVFISLLCMKIELKNKVLDFLGAMTLEIYLTHVLFVELFSEKFINNFDPLFYIKNPFLYLAVIIGLTIPLAWGIYLLRTKVLPWIINAPFFLWAIKILKKCAVVAVGLLVLVTLYYSITSHITTSKTKVGVEKYKNGYISFTKIGENEVASFITGSGEHTILLLDELSDPCASMTFRPIAEKLGEHYKVIVPDMPGFGFSENAVSPRTLQNITAELNELIQKLNDGKPVILFAFHEAGIYAESFVQNYPDRVEAMIGFDAATWEVIEEHFDVPSLTDEQLYYETKRSGQRERNWVQLQNLTGFIRLKTDYVTEAFKFTVMKDHLDELLEVLLAKNAGKASIDAKANLIVESRGMKEFKLPVQLPVLLMCSHDADTQLEPSLFEMYKEILTNEKIQQAVLTESLTNYIYYKPDLLVENVIDFITYFLSD